MTFLLAAAALVVYRLTRRALRTEPDFWDGHPRPDIYQPKETP